jgi:hypothetical protein
MIFVEGDTSTRAVTLYENGSPMSLTGCTVTLLVRATLPLGTVRPTVVVTSGIVITNAANGLIAYTPAVGQLTATEQPYVARWQVTDAGGNARLCPFPDADTWQVLS